MAEEEIKTVDIVDFSMQSKPIKVTDAFNQIMSAKVVDSLAGKKQYISTKMFSNKEMPTTGEPEVEVEAETTEEQ